MIILLVYLFAGKANAFDKPPTNLVPYKLKFTTDVIHFDSSANYDNEGGSFESLPDGQSYKNTLFKLKLDYDFSKKWSVGTGIGIARAESIDDSQITRTNSTPTEITLSTKYLLKTRPFRLYPTFQFGYPLNRIDENTDEVLTGEGAMFVEPGIWTTKLLFGLYNYLYLGYKYQDQGRAGILPWKIGTSFLQKSYNLAFELSGNEVITDDENVDNPSERSAVTAKVNGGSFRYYSVNSKVLEAKIHGGFRITPGVRIRLGLGKTINGENAAEGLSFYASASLAWSFSAWLGNRPSGSQSRRDVKDFDVQDKSYDESLFEESRPRQRRIPVKTDEQLLNEVEESVE